MDDTFCVVCQKKLTEWRRYQTYGIRVTICNANYINKEGDECCDECLEWATKDDKDANNG